MQPDLDLDMSKTYIYDGEEFILTGRVAEREQELVPKRRSRRRRQIEEQSPEQDLMVEIAPVPRGRPIGSLNDEKKWVKYSDLYAVMNMLHEDEE